MKQILREGNRHRARIIINKVCCSALAIDTFAYIVNSPFVHILNFIFFYNDL